MNIKEIMELESSQLKKCNNASLVYFLQEKGKYLPAVRYFENEKLWHAYLFSKGANVKSLTTPVLRLGYYFTKPQALSALEENSYFCKKGEFVREIFQNKILHAWRTFKTSTTPSVTVQENTALYAIEQSLEDGLIAVDHASFTDWQWIKADSVKEWEGNCLICKRSSKEAEFVCCSSTCNLPHGCHLKCLNMTERPDDYWSCASIPEGICKAHDAITKRQDAIKALNGKKPWCPVIGINWNKKMKKWKVQFTHEGQRYHLGLYELYEEDKAIEHLKEDRLRVQSGLQPKHLASMRRKESLSKPLKNKEKHTTLSKDLGDIEHSEINSANCMICGKGDREADFLLCECATPWEHGCHYDCVGLDSIPEHAWTCKVHQQTSDPLEVLRSLREVMQMVNSREKEKETEEKVKDKDKDIEQKEKEVEIFEQEEPIEVKEESESEELPIEPPKFTLGKRRTVEEIFHPKKRQKMSENDMKTVVCDYCNHAMKISKDVNYWGVWCCHTCRIRKNAKTARQKAHTKVEKTHSEEHPLLPRLPSMDQVEDGQEESPSALAKWEEKVKKLISFPNFGIT